VQKFNERAKLLVVSPNIVLRKDTIRWAKIVWFP